MSNDLLCTGAVTKCVTSVVSKLYATGYFQLCAISYALTLTNQDCPPLLHNGLPDHNKALHQYSVVQHSTTTVFLCAQQACMLCTVSLFS